MIDETTIYWKPSSFSSGCLIAVSCNCGEHIELSDDNRQVKCICGKVYKLAVVGDFASHYLLKE